MRHHRSIALGRTGPVITALVAAVLLAPTAAVAAVDPDGSRPLAVDSTSGNTVAKWSAFADESVVAACVSPARERQMMAALHIAVSDALNAIALRSQPIAFTGQEPLAYARSAVAAAASTSLMGVLRSAPGLTADCRQTRTAIVKRAAEKSMATLPDRPSDWIGVVLGEAAASAAVSWTAQHPVGPDLVSMRLARAEADSRGLSMWETATLLARCSTTGC